MSEKSNLAKSPAPEDAVYVACCTCMTEIPESVAMSSEADEYTQYFCGIECYTKWRDAAAKAKATKSATDKTPLK